MDAKTIQRRLAQGLVLANPTSSVWVEDETYLHFGLFTIEVGPDRVVIGPSGDKLTPEELTLLADPDSLLWLVALFNDEHFPRKIVRFLQQHKMKLAEDWLG